MNSIARGGESKSETRRDAEILVRNPSPRLFGKKFRDSKKVKTRLRDFETQKRFWDFEILPEFSETHVFRGTIRHPYSRLGQFVLSSLLAIIDIIIVLLGVGVSAACEPGRKKLGRLNERTREI